MRALFYPRIMSLALDFLLCFQKLQFLDLLESHGKNFFNEIKKHFSFGRGARKATKRDITRFE